MYWQRSIFSITSKADVELLSRIYEMVEGELEIYRNKSCLLKIEWTTNPFKALLLNPNINSFKEILYYIDRNHDLNLEGILWK